MFSQLLRALYLEADYRSWRAARAAALGRPVEGDGIPPRYRFLSLRIRGLV